MKFVVTSRAACLWTEQFSRCTKCWFNGSTALLSNITVVFELLMKTPLKNFTIVVIPLLTSLDRQSLRECLLWKMLIILLMVSLVVVITTCTQAGRIRQIHFLVILYE